MLFVKFEAMRGRKGSTAHELFLYGFMHLPSSVFTALWGMRYELKEAALSVFQMQLVLIYEMKIL